jgi:hypothetical protein
MGDSASSLSTTFSLRLDPVPESIDFYVAAGTFTAHMSRQLRAAVLDGTNWRFNQGGFWFRGNVVTASGTTVSGTVLPDFLGPAGVDTCDFAPPPFDLLARDLTPGQAFSGFPLTVHP